MGLPHPSALGVVAVGDGVWAGLDPEQFPQRIPAVRLRVAARGLGGEPAFIVVGEAVGPPVGPGHAREPVVREARAAVRPISGVIGVVGSAPKRDVMPRKVPRRRGIAGDLEVRTRLLYRVRIDVIVGVGREAIPRVVREVPLHVVLVIARVDVREAAAVVVREPPVLMPGGTHVHIHDPRPKVVVVRTRVDAKVRGRRTRRIHQRVEELVHRIVDFGQFSPEVGEFPWVLDRVVPEDQGIRPRPVRHRQQLAVPGGIVAHRRREGERPALGDDGDHVPFGIRGHGVPAHRVDGDPPMGIDRARRAVVGEPRGIRARSPERHAPQRIVVERRCVGNAIHREAQQPVPVVARRRRVRLRIGAGDGPPEHVGHRTKRQAARVGDRRGQPMGACILGIADARRVRASGKMADPRRRLNSGYRARTTA